MSIRRIVMAVLVLAFAASVLGAPIRRVGKPIKDEYIVVLQGSTGSVEARAQRLSRMVNGQIHAIYTVLAPAFSINMTEEQARRVADDPDVAWVEQDGIVEVAQAIAHEANGISDMWGLDRIDQRAVADDRFDDSYTYCSSGSNVRAYVIDTGILPNHPEFIAGYMSKVDTSASQNWTSYMAQHGGADLGYQCWDTHVNNFTAVASHGTSVASLIAGNTFGVAKSVTLVDVRTFNCSGAARVSDVALAFDWIAWHNSGRGQAVVNCSFTFSTYEDSGSLILSQIQRMETQEHVRVVAAAGNFNSSTYWYTPARSPYAITAGALTQSADERWSASNYGYGTAVYAPGQFVEAACTTSRAAGLTFDRNRSELSDCDDAEYIDGCTSGTSFAAAFTTGVVARYLETHTGTNVTRGDIVGFLQAQAATHTGVIVSDGQGGSAPVLNMVDCY